MGQTREAVERIIGRAESPASPSEITLIPRAKKVIELAIDEARKLGHDDIGTEHLLLGILRDDTSIACRILIEQGAPLEKVRAYVLATIGGQPPLSGEPPPAPGA
jgi:ATP-dependent Clp protease ATP-binding subunit ClpC